jgi:hypothetical protein
MKAVEPTDNFTLNDRVVVKKLLHVLPLKFNFSCFMEEYVYLCLMKASHVESDSLRTTVLRI